MTLLKRSQLSQALDGKEILHSEEYTGITAVSGAGAEMHRELMQARGTAGDQANCFWAPMLPIALGVD